MTNDNRPQSLWQNQQLEGIRISAEEIRRRAGKFQKRIFRRNAREYAAALFVVVFFGFQFWHVTDAVVRAGVAMLIAGILYVVWHLHKQGASRNLPAEMGLASGLEFHRRELERQRDLVRSVGRWYLGPMIPGWVVLAIGVARTNPGRYSHFALSFTLFQTIAALVFIGVWILNQRAARKLQRRIDELDALRGPDSTANGESQ